MLEKIKLTFLMILFIAIISLFIHEFPEVMNISDERKNIKE